MQPLNDQQPIGDQVRQLYAEVVRLNQVPATHAERLKELDERLTAVEKVVSGLAIPVVEPAK